MGRRGAARPSIGCHSELVSSLLAPMQAACQCYLMHASCGMPCFVTSLALAKACVLMSFMFPRLTPAPFIDCSPGCFTMLTVDCQQHAHHRNQFR